MMDERIAQAANTLAQRLILTQASLTTVESCTGGGIAYALTSESGSSDWFRYGFVTYANEAKTALVGVKPSLLTHFGAVSEQVAREMAKGGVKSAGADYAISVTGIAGPTGGSENKPVGTVFFGWSDKIGHVKVSRQLFTGDREQIRIQAIAFAIEGLSAFIEENDS